MEETIDLKQFYQIFKKRIWFILILTLLSGIIVFIINVVFLTPIYQASTQILVNQERNEQTAINYNEVQTNIQLVNTYNLIIKSPAVLDSVASVLDSDISVSDLQKKINVASQNQSQIMNVTVQDEDPEQAAIIANKTAAVFKEKIVEFMKVDNVTILSEAKLDAEPNQVKPRSLINTAIALLIGLAVGIGVSLLMELMNTTIKDEQEIEKLFNLPVLGVITSFDAEDTANQAKSRSKSKSKSKMRGDKFGFSKK